MTTTKPTMDRAFFELMQQYFELRKSGASKAEEGAVFRWAMQRYIAIYRAGRAGTPEGRQALKEVMNRAPLSFLIAIRKQARSQGLLSGHGRKGRR